MAESKTKTVVSTGSREIDDKMGGGVPLGSLTLIEGDSHSGKSVLSQQMTWGSLHDGFTPLLLYDRKHCQKPGQPDAQPEY